MYAIFVTHSITVYHTPYSFYDINKYPIGLSFKPGTVGRNSTELPFKPDKARWDSTRLSSKPGTVGWNSTGLLVESGTVGLESNGFSSKPRTDSIGLRPNLVR
jgi:hypothetical protein